MNIEIKKLTKEQTEDYLRFFDITPHSERADDDESKCYCVWWCRDTHNDKVFAEELATREKRRVYAAKSIESGNIQGYLAYYNGEVVGWCNTNEKRKCYNCFCWINFMGAIRRDEDEGKKIKSVFCFTVSPKMRKQGVASALLNRVCEDAKAEGFDAVEGYPNLSFIDTAQDFMGPAALYERQGFYEHYRTDTKLVMRKDLK